MMQSWLNKESTRKTLIRGLYMLLFWLILTMVSYVLGILVMVQFFFVLVTRKPNSQLLMVSDLVGQYIRYILAFLTFHQEQLPYPFGQWQE